MPLNSLVVPLTEAHFHPLHAVLDEVAREKRYLAMLQAPPREHTFAFLRDSLDKRNPHVVALLDGEVVGWCDVLPVFGEARRHVGMLGIGLVRCARRQGLGRALLEAAIASAWAKGLTRIELTVRADNHNARELYERLGFQHEGRQYGSFQVDGETFDSHAMALLRQDSR